MSDRPDSAGSESFDVIIIGGGPGGYVAAIRAAQLGLKTACVESRGSLGGTCLNVGCIPSKALLQSTELYSAIQHKAADHGIKVSKVSVELADLLKRKDKVVKGLTTGIEGLFKKNKITWLKGFGSFLGPQRVAVKGADGKTTEYGAKSIVIATGSEPVNIKVAPFDHKRICDSTDALSFDEVPEHLCIIGGGYIGLEMGSVWARLGAKVTVVEALPKILPAMDDGVSREMTKILQKQGLEFMVGTKVVGTEVTAKGVTVKADRGGESVTIKCDKVLVCVGRKAFTEGLNLAAAGLEARQDGKIATDAHFRTKTPGVYAIGDVIDGPMLAHKAEDEGVAVSEIIAGKPGHVNYEAIPGVVYTWPEVATVGLTEQQCKEKGLAYRSGQFPFLANGRARALGDTEGFVKVLADAKTDKILGVHIVGPNASELIAEAAIAVEFGASAEDLARSTHAHPTLSEVMKEACLGVDKRTLHM